MTIAVDSSANQSRPFRIALAGNPNCGKTTLFNALTGLRHKVANYPGVTVERKVGACVLAPIGKCTVIDLPGIYSLSGTSIDEAIATRAILGGIKGEDAPDLIVAVLDASNLERNLYLASQLIDLEIPVLIALNMSDIARERGISIRTELLSRALGAPVLELVAAKGKGIEQLKEAIIESSQNRKSSDKAGAWLGTTTGFRDAAKKLGAAAQSESQINSAKIPGSDFITGCSLLSESLSAGSPQLKVKAQELRDQLLAQGLDPYSFEATERYQWIHAIIEQSCVFEDLTRKRFSEKIDSIITHKIWGSLIFILLMALIFQAIFLWASLPMDFIDQSFASLGAWLTTILEPGKFRSLLVDGIIAGVGSVVIFIPQIAILFLFLGILEDSGYLSRAAFLMDKVMRQFGLQGRSFIPLLSSFACAIPGIMSTRTIPSFSDRMTTILVAPLMSCSARLPVYTLLIAAFIPPQYYFGFVSLQGLVLLGMYLLGVLAAVVVAWILKKTLFRGEPALFVMEMPIFKMPSFKLVLRDVADRVFLFLKSAGTVILACSVILWFLATTPSGPIKDTYAGRIGQLIEPAIKPIGLNWEFGVGILASFAAREVFVSSLATVYHLADGDAQAESLIATLRRKHESGEMSVRAAIALMIFYVFACMCMSTLAVCRRETGSWGWTAFMFVYMTALAYISALAFYQGSAYFMN